jgi:hypothetical protein
MKKKSSPKRGKAKKSKMSDLPPRKTVKGGLIGIRGPSFFSMR